MDAWLHGCMKEIMNVELKDINVFAFNIIFSPSAVGGQWPAVKFP
jgi:hypothetical protein